MGYLKCRISRLDLSFDIDIAERVDLKVFEDSIASLHEHCFTLLFE